MGPPLLHGSSEKHMVVVSLGYTPDAPTARFRTPSAPQLDGVRLSMTRTEAH
jgi:hypothetical protein